ncbi:M23 family metallopeptidase [Arenibacter sp. GZD96]|uniref:M23 family metallopeptidase n=1 Tax=Aurantibrevibacter litoralis TaxID=3106030 RepID=UPI002AFEE299|nr:M23 family metallopeptidase [Arenibacter sp. GZD-96]MEA1785953.1 M23 family metallopeptidase [Arenibacter sp. GZD-96]
MKKNVIGLLFFLAVHSNAQENYPTDVFRAPLDIPLILAGNFGELRSNHFHSGIDIKTQGREGLPIYAIGDGTVTRIKIATSGYGKVLYLGHPNGYTSVYAHLQKFSPSIEAYIKKIQYQKQEFEVEAFPELGELSVQKGEIIAYSGNTGSSSGPHLHFEIRHSLSENATNPLLYGLDIADTTAPTLSGLYGYPLGSDAQINQSNDRVQLRYTKQADGSFLADKVTALGTIGFGFSGYDRQDLAANRNGIYEVTQLVNGKVYALYNFNSFSFNESRFINTLIDYPYYIYHRRHIQKSFRAPGNQLSIFKNLFNEGKIDIAEGMSYTVEVYLKDLEQNTTKITIPVEGKKEVLKVKKEKQQTDHYIMAKKPNNFDLGIAKVYFPANTFYEDFYIDLQQGDEKVKIHDGSIPAHTNFTITFDVTPYNEKEREQLFIARLDSRNEPIYATTYKRGNTFTTRTRYLGSYSLAKDSVPPTIRPKNFRDKQWLTNYRYLSLEIKDDLSGINTYSATLNGHWILMEYEYKNNTLTYNFEDINAENDQFELKLTVTDNVGNVAEYNSSFFRK